MKRLGRTLGFRLVWLVLFLVMGTQLSGFSQHAIFDISFSPTSPAELQFGDLVHWKLNYRTTAPGGVRIYGYPLTEGTYSGGMWHSGSPLYPTGPGSSSGHFTITSGEKTVDQVRFVMVDAANVALFHTTVAVTYKFSESSAGPGMTRECVCEETVETDYGSFRVCVTVDYRPEENWDCYTYYITNIDYCPDDCGLCGFYVRNAHGHATTYQWGPYGWLLNWPDGDVWQWHAPPGTCGIMPGETRRMGFCVPASTEVDEEQEAAIWGCRWELAVTGALTPARRCPWKFHTCGPGPRPVDPQRCTYAIAPTGWVAPECGGSTIVQLTTQPGCPWTAQSNDAWLTVSPTSGTGSAAVSVTASSNDTGQTRSGSVIFTGTNWTATLIVHQRPCTPALADLVIQSISHTPLNPTIGQQVTFTVVTRNQGSADAGSFAVHLQGAGPAAIAGVSSLAAGASITHTMVLPLTTSPETFTATADAFHQVTESDETNNTRTHIVRGVSPCTYSINPTSWTAPECGGWTTVQLTTQAGCPWTAQSSTAWLTVSPTSGTGSASVRVTATSNNTGQTRTGIVTFAGTNWTATLTVHQRPCQTGCVDSIRPTSAHFPARGGSVAVSISTSLRVCPWTATSPCAWVTVSPSSGSGSGSVTVTVSPNRGRQPRSCTLTIAGRSFTVTQDGG